MHIQLIERIVTKSYEKNTFSACFNLSSFSVAVWKVDGNNPGKILIAIGSKNSMKGTIIKTEKGISLNISPVVFIS